MSDPITPQMVLAGYAGGIFPMADPDGEIYWYSPDPRTVFEFDRFHVPKSLRPVLKQKRFEIRVNTAFAEVIAACGERDEGTWISPQIAALYTEVHRAGFAHSVETWQDGQLVGGLYGVTLGGAFFGESMFHRVRDASKVALVKLMERLQARGYTLVDTQWSTPHLARFGAVEIPRAEYLERLDHALRQRCTFRDP